MPCFTPFFGLSREANHQGTSVSTSFSQQIRPEEGEVEAKDQETNDATTTGKEEQVLVSIQSNTTLPGIQKNSILNGPGAELFDVLWSQYWRILIVAITVVYPIFLLVLAGCYISGLVDSFAAVLGCIGLVYAALLCVIISTFLTSALPAILLLQLI